MGGSERTVGGTIRPHSGGWGSCAAELGLLGHSAAHLQILSQLSRLSATDVEILISGPTGVGKELYARFVHRCSRRDDERFVAVNCGALPDTLLENELFGHGQGAFTGADRYTEGLIAAAENGTLFLDEVDALSPAAQVKLLRFLQQREYRRLGESRLRRANVAVIAATNADLNNLVCAKKFRQDLFFRLHVMPLHVPPLRDRPEDVAVLLEGFVARLAERYKLDRVVFTPRAIDRLMCYGWPGNVRELENLVRNLTCQQLGRAVDIGDLTLLDDREAWRQPASKAAASVPFYQAKQDAITEFEVSYLEDVMRRANGNIAQAARLACKHRRALFELLRKHRIDAREYRPGIESSNGGNGQLEQPAQ